MFAGYLKVAIALTVGVFPFPSVLASEHLFPNGVFLYGQSSQPDEIGQEYLVFEVQGNQVKGAIYFPDSEFSCFEGQLRPETLHLNIADPENQIAYPMQISLHHEAISASVTIPRPMVSLEGYYPIESWRVGEAHPRHRDQSLLNTCLSDG